MIDELFVISVPLLVFVVGYFLSKPLSVFLQPYFDKFFGFSKDDKE